MEMPKSIIEAIEVKAEEEVAEAEWEGEFQWGGLGFLLRSINIVTLLTTPSPIACSTLACHGIPILEVDPNQCQGY